MTEVVVNLLTLREGVEPARFARFSRERDRPTCLREEVVEGFDAYVVERADGDAAAPQVVEVMRVRSWDAWVEVRDEHPAIQALSAEFDELVAPDGVRSYVVRPLDTAEVPA